MIMVTAVCSIESIIPVCSIYKIKSVSKLQESIRMNEPTIRLPPRERVGWSPSRGHDFIRI